MAILPNYREHMTVFVPWTPSDAAHHVAVPVESSDKYSRGVLGVITGSDQYPGAAVLGVDAALHTGVGMVRYLGGARVTDMVLSRRPEAVASDGRVQAWLIGSGTDHASKESDAETLVDKALSQSLPVVLDGGALERVRSLTGPAIITPHFGELARVLQVDKALVAADPARWALTAADTFGVTVLLKGHTTFVAGGGVSLSVSQAPTWLATAGAGDALAGILGALVATHGDADTAELARLGATASVIHGLAATGASQGGPFTITGLIERVPGVIAELVAYKRPARIGF
jgi:hydroxyethylthiazole kinase-like uncharacterized protein yjeF